MKNLLLGLSLGFLGLSSLYSSNALAACDQSEMYGQQNFSKAGWEWRFGAYTNAQASGAGECNYSQTSFTKGDFLTKQTSSSSAASISGVDIGGVHEIKSHQKATASISSFSVSASTDLFNTLNQARGNHSASVVDLVWVENPDGEASDTTEIPMRYCSNYSSDADGKMGSNESYLSYIDYNYGAENAYYDSINYDGQAKITHAQPGRICRTGSIHMAGKYLSFSLALSSWDQGKVQLYPFDNAYGSISYIHGRKGKISANFSWNLPAGYKCYSASGSFPGCGRKMYKSKIAAAPNANPVKESSGMCSASQSPLKAGANAARKSLVSSASNLVHDVFKFIGNPINFALGYKHQSETDYSGGLLSFSRIYRSDSEWTSDVIGTLWRHNYDRVLNVISTPESTTVDITDSSGAMIIFREDDLGNWEPIDQDITATFEALYDATVLSGYLYTTSNDTREHYDIDGKLTRIEYQGSQALDFTYDGSLRLSSVTDESGQSLTFGYDGSGRISTLVTPDGTFGYAYDANGNLTTVTKPDTKIRVYHYEDAIHLNALTGITNEKGVRYATYGYDAEGRAVSSEHAGGVDKYSITYNDDGTTTTTNPLGKQTTYHFETILGVRKIVSVEGHQSTNCAAANKDYTYDARGFLESKTDWKGNITTYLRDDRGLVTSKTQALGTTAERTTGTTYDPVFRLPDVITEAGRTTDYDYDAHGRTVSETITDTATGKARITTYAYHPNDVDASGNTILGRLASIDSSRTDVSDITSFEYGANFRLIKTTNALGHVSETLAFDAADRPTLTRDANGIKTKLVYDVQGRLLRQIQGINTSIKAITRYVYNDDGQLRKTISPNGTFVRYAYDDAGRLIRVINSDSKIIYKLDNAGNRTREVYKDSAGTMRYRYKQRFDELSRLIRGIKDNGDRTRHVYDVNGNLIREIDGNLNKTKFAYDGLDRQIRTIDALNGKTANSFNDLDQLKRVKDPRNNVTRYVYNAFGDVLRQISPDTEKTVYRVDEAGNIIWRKDARGVVTRYVYDALNRLTKVRYPSDPSLNVTLTYDMVNGCGSSVGRLCRVKDAGGITRYIYDELGRLTRVKEIRGGLILITRYGYDLAGNLTSITYPSGRVVSYTLNGNGQVIAVDDGTTNLANSVTYLPFGGIESLTYGNGIALTNIFNTSYQLTSRQIGSLFYDTYEYDGVGNITVKGATSYIYDPLYRLTDENSSAGLFNYSYDAIGNRLTETKNGSFETYIYPSDSSRLSDIGAVSIITDVAGNITTDAQRSYTINAAGQVQEVSISGAVVGTYSYDANNQRTSKTVNGITTHYVYGAGGLLYGEYDSTGNLIREYVYLGSKPLAQIDAGENLLYLHTDHLGTPRVASDSTASQVWNWQSDTFGNAAPTGTATINLRFAGQYYDAETNLHYNWNRYYNPKTGRYITSDPIGLDGGLNTYAYVSANPVMFTDPEGLVMWEADIQLKIYGKVVLLEMYVEAKCGSFKNRTNVYGIGGVVDRWRDFHKILPPHLNKGVMTLDKLFKSYKDNKATKTITIKGVKVKDHYDYPDAGVFSGGWKYNYRNNRMFFGKAYAVEQVSFGNRSITGIAWAGKQYR